ncbi:AraC family transcriptional regulator [Acinetobacter sp. P8-3-8]|uniref:helix-turn-helix domain-containing protein n=1 Tax=Acinetobacter sp. P8-3-8 TaxID=1029823 RepID=UPI0002487A61|nr:AraC family transcriptional regulator [Acinetobacter sp. P8-3-8]
MSELDRTLKTLSFPQQFIDIGINILNSLDVFKNCNFYNINTENLNTLIQTIDGKMFISALNALYNQLPKDQLASAIFLEKTPLTAYGPFGLLVLTAPTVGEAFQCLLDYLEQLIPVIEVATIESGHQVHYTFKLRYDFGEINHFLTEVITLTALTGRPFLSQSLQHTTVHFAHAPLNTIEMYETAFDANFQFNRAQNALIMSKKDLDITLTTANPTTHAWIKSQLNQQIKLLGNTNLTSNHVKRFIMQSLKNNTVINATSISEALSISERTLSRRLNEEGHSLSDLKLEVGVEYAQLLLLDTNKSMNEIALSAGFNNATSFSRAFKRFTSQTPSQFKKNKK